MAAHLKGLLEIKFLLPPSKYRNGSSFSSPSGVALMIAILKMANVKYGLIMIGLVMLSFTMSFIYYICMIKYIMCVM